MKAADLLLIAGVVAVGYLAFRVMALRYQRGQMQPAVMRWNELNGAPLTDQDMLYRRA